MTRSPTKRRIASAERAHGRRPVGAAPVPADPRNRYRAYLLVPIVPIVALLGFVFLGIVLRWAPGRPVMVVLVAALLVASIDAARRDRPRLVVAMVLFWPLAIGYLAVRVLRLGS